ncbi:hypothetical protein BDM02DRAFT_488130 [Thelephora ganbajun]|uniref:Uncharacterized protein n=1 Tax=Thelephora ganbajun TaxID=370292 RepID=A0ACB6Z7Y8_THEGA|nr:hypothetical protein BDM02DRAFT_488130 [Thelephora ganbajun]
MIPSQFPVIDSLNSWGAGKNLLQTWHRHMAFRVLAATSTRLRTIFYERSWRTRVTTETDLPVMVGFLKQIGVHVHGLFVEKLITQLPRDSTLLMRDCLLALPSLHTLVIVDGCYNGTGWIKSVFKHKPDFPQIRNVTIPAFAHPILSRLPNMEELVCYCNISWRSVLKPVLSSLRGPYVKERHGKVEPVLKSFTVICPAREWDFSEGPSPRNFQGYAKFVCQSP